MSGVYTLEDVRAHTSKDDLWIVLHNKVYNVTPYLDDHPGGIDILIDVAGTDATADFEDVGHSDDAREQLEPMLIGTLHQEHRTEELELYKLEYVQTVAAPILKSSSSTWSRFGSPIIKLLTVGSLGYIAFSSHKKGAIALSANPRHLLNTFSTFSAPRSQGGFWKGFAVAAAASAALFGALGLTVQHAMEIQKDYSIFPPSLKSKYRVYRKTAPETIVRQPVLHPQEYRKFTLAKKEKLSPNVFHFVFALPDSNDVLGLPIGQHVAVRADIAGKSVVRSYTPTSNDSDLGRLELVIKIYPSGLLTNYLAALEVGDQMDIRGPKGSMKYHKDLCRNIGMIAGGTGITPMYQLIREICEDDSDSTNISLIYANHTEDDILLRQELDGFAATCPHKFKVWYVLNIAPEGWQYSTGYATKELIEERFAPLSEDNKAMLCGPPGMISAMKNNLMALGYEKPAAVSKATDQIFTF